MYLVSLGFVKVIDESLKQIPDFIDFVSGTTKKTKYRPGIGLAIPVSRYRSGDTSLTGIGLAIPVFRPIHDNKM